MSWLYELALTKDERSYVDLWRNCQHAKCEYANVSDIPIDSRRSW